MKKGEFISGPEFSYEYFREFAGIKFRFVSDDLFLKEIDFYKGKKFNETCSPPPSAPLSMIVKYFEAYFSGTGAERFSILFRHNFKDKMVIKGSGHGESIVLDLENYTEREASVYRELIKIVSGNRISYGDLAAKSGIPGGARFIGNTMAKNRFPVIVPCHRVVKSDGSLGNFSGGVDIKEKLLRHESGLRAS